MTFQVATSDSSVPRTRGDGPVSGRDTFGSFGGVPRTRGDGPDYKLLCRAVTDGVPRTRGDGPDTSHRITQAAAVFPAHAGMDR